LTTYKKEERRYITGEGEDYLPEESLLGKACRYGAIVLLAGGAALGFYKGVISETPRAQPAPEIRSTAPSALEKTVESRENNGLAQKTATE
jgi:hypothetical protein